MTILVNRLNTKELCELMTVEQYQAHSNFIQKYINLRMHLHLTLAISHWHKIQVDNSKKCF